MKKKEMKQPGVPVKLKREEILQLKDVLKRGAVETKYLRARADLIDVFRMIAGYYAAEVTAREKDFEWDEPTQQHLADIARSLVEPKAFCIFLCGTCGNGKTTAMMAFRQTVNQLARAGAFRVTMGCFWKPQMEIYSAMDLVEICSSRPKEFERIRNLNMLGIDDIGAEPAEVLSYGNVYNPIMRLIEYRYSKMLYTFCTSNLEPSVIRPRYGERVADRMNEMCTKIIYTNSSYRAAGRQPSKGSQGSQGDSQVLEAAGAAGRQPGVRGR